MKTCLRSFYELKSILYVCIFNFTFSCSNSLVLYLDLINTCLHVLCNNANYVNEDALNKVSNNLAYLRL